MLFFFLFFNDTATTEIYTLSLHDALPIYIYPLRIRNVQEMQRDKIIERIFAREVAVNVHFQLVPMMSFYKGLGYSPESYPVAFDSYTREITLPVYTDLTESDMDKVITAVVGAVSDQLAVDA